MKKVVFLSLVALGLAACADNRSSVNSEATTWEKVQYQVGAEKQDLSNNAQ